MAGRNVTAAPEKEWKQSKETAEKLTALTSVFCAPACSTACPSYCGIPRISSGLPRLLQARRWLVDSRDEATGHGLDTSRTRSGSIAVTPIMNCRQGLPEESQSPRPSPRFKGDDGQAASLTVPTVKALTPPQPVRRSAAAAYPTGRLPAALCRPSWLSQWYRRRA